MSRQAYKNFVQALESTVIRFAKMGVDGRLAAAIKLIDESGVEHSINDDLVSVLGRIAELGSIDAAALMIGLGGNHQQVLEALRSIAARSKDVVDGLAHDALVTKFEEWAEQEIAAGRMTKTLDPETGRYLYRSIEDKA